MSIWNQTPVDGLDRNVTYLLAFHSKCEYLVADGTKRRTDVVRETWSTSLDGKAIGHFLSQEFSVHGVLHEPPYPTQEQGRACLARQYAHKLEL